VTGQPPPDSRPGCTPVTPSLQPGRVTRPAGARAELSAVPAGYQGGDARARWKAALAARSAALRRGRFTRAAGKTGPGMIRKPPPGSDTA